MLSARIMAVQLSDYFTNLISIKYVSFKRLCAIFNTCLYGTSFAVGIS